jgi:hypothetical protein
MTRLAFIALAFAAVAACDPYDPDLGPTPFECGGDDNVCPEGYTCDTATDICQPTEGANIDAAGFTCENDSSLEPNDAPNQAYITPIPNAGLTYALFGLSVCPGTDVDHFKFGVNAAANLEVTVVGLSDRMSLRLDLLNSSGTVIYSGTPVNGSEQQVKMEMGSNRLGIGDYFVRVRSSDGVENNYNITIKTCTNPLPCP